MLTFDVQKFLPKLHCGLFHCPAVKAFDVMPELKEIYSRTFMEDNLQYPFIRYVLDVKVHMLMPNQWPCIPNWHYDMVPRNENGEQDFSRINGDYMYLCVTNAPFPEFEDGREVKPFGWTRFTQYDLHRGTIATEHCWRMFMRLCPDTIMKPAPEHMWLRRHSQVYLNADNFTW